MFDCCQCEGIERQFGKRTAARDLRRYRRNGPIPSTRRLVEALRAEGVEGASLLDIGGGIGAIQHELLHTGVRHAVHVDAASHYLRASREEARRQGHAHRVTYLHADFVEAVGDIAAADIVTLDRVICCYPDMPRLVEAAASKAERLLGLVFPRVRSATRLALPATNLVYRLRRIPFQLYLHSPQAVDAVLRRQGLFPRRRSRSVLWNIRVYARKV